MPNMYNEIYGYCDNEHGIDLNKCMCENITDCILKQIVDYCKDVEEYSDDYYTRPILEKLDIQEFE